MITIQKFGCPSLGQRVPSESNATLSFICVQPANAHTTRGKRNGRRINSPGHPLELSLFKIFFYVVGSGSRIVMVN